MKLILCLLLAVLAHGAELKCGQCHAEEARQQQHSAMAHAIAVPGANPVLQKHALLQTEKGAYKYTIATNRGDSVYSVTDGTSTISVPIHWSFGQDNQTFVFEYQGNWYEGLVSYFSKIDGLDTTIGDASIVPKTVLEAIGRPIVEEERSACFGCHSSTALAGNEVRPGVTCDHCHANALEHQAAILKGSLKPLPPKLHGLSAFDTSNFCGQCHRTWEAVMRMPALGASDVRFQPYRLADSKCFNGGDARISCTACHNPHSASMPTAERVTAQCTSCHNGTAEAKVCPVSKTDCASCHMPKVDLPGGHRLFTDHDIRIVKAGEPYPY